MEQQFRDRAAASGENVSIQRMVCASTRCAMTMDTPSREAVMSIPGWFVDGRVAFEGKPVEDGYECNAVYIRDGYDIEGQAVRQ